MKTVNILGTEYSYKRDNLNNPDLAQNDGVCRVFDKEIIVREIQYMDGTAGKGKQYREDHVIRHELIHAFAEESGVQYGNDEALVDWIAHIIPLVNKAFDEVKGIE